MNIGDRRLLIHFPSLAWAELRLCFAYVFRKFDMKLEEPAYVEI